MESDDSRNLFYLSSLPCDVGRIAHAISSPLGGFENQLHWVLDVTFGEDACRIRTGHGPDNFALLRRLAISVLNQETSKKRSLRQKSKTGGNESGLHAHRVDCSLASIA